MTTNPPDRRIEVYVKPDRQPVVDEAKKLKPDNVPFSSIILDALELWIHLVGKAGMGDLLEKTSILSGQSYSETIRRALTRHYKELGGNDALKSMVRKKKGR